MSFGRVGEPSIWSCYSCRGWDAWDRGRVASSWLHDAQQPGSGSRFVRRERPSQRPHAYASVRMGYVALDSAKPRPDLLPSSYPSE